MKKGAAANSNAEKVEKAAPPAGGGCPVKHSKAAGKYLNPNQYNVYSQKVDPSNNMPSMPKQSQAPGQRMPLSTDRVSSTIPKGGTEGTWSYPSPQMFWNAITRKGKVEDTQEEDMNVVVAIHNNMNENTWKQILHWESLRGELPKNANESDSDGSEPKLLRFLGRPDDISPKAWFKGWMGCPTPFDRHDWVVDRNGEERRYVIDYYYDESQSKDDSVPGLHDTDKIKSIKVDVRPALDAPSAFIDRFLWMPYERRVGGSSFTPLPMLSPKALTQPEPEPKNAQQSGSISSDERAEVLKLAQKNCGPKLAALKECQGEKECGQASVALTYCMGKLVCKEQAAKFDAAGDGGDEMEVAFTAMQSCLEEYGEKAGSS
ncbi:unnamed protein product [Chrysoparadoxa australica]